MAVGGAVATVEVDGGVPKWGEPGDVGRVDRIALRGELVEGGLDVYGLPQHIGRATVYRVLDRAASMPGSAAAPGPSPAMPA